MATIFSTSPALYASSHAAVMALRAASSAAVSTGGGAAGAHALNAITVPITRARCPKVRMRLLLEGEGAVGHAHTRHIIPPGDDVEVQSADLVTEAVEPPRPGGLRYSCAEH